MTYPAHVILRYNLERAMIAGDLDPADLPGAWNDGMRKLLGDHAAERPARLPAGHPLVRAAPGATSRPTRWAPWRRRKFSRPRLAAEPGDPATASRAATSRRWSAGCGANMHGKGSLLPARELLTEATGRPLDPDAFKAHLRQRYLG